ncbi:unnamed protein product [Lampetra planeri]
MENAGPAHAATRESGAFQIFPDPRDSVQAGGFSSISSSNISSSSSTISSSSNIISSSGSASAAAAFRANKQRLPSIVVEPTDGNEVESGELRWPPEEVLSAEDDEEEVEDEEGEEEEAEEEPFPETQPAVEQKRWIKCSSAIQERPWTASGPVEPPWKVEGPGDPPHPGGPED